MPQTTSKTPPPAVSSSTATNNVSTKVSEESPLEFLGNTINLDDPLGSIMFCSRTPMKELAQGIDKSDKSDKNTLGGYLLRYYYQPKCPGCHAFTPEWNRFAQNFAQDPRIKFDTIDTTTLEGSLQASRAQVAKVPSITIAKFGKEGDLAHPEQLTENVFKTESEQDASQLTNKLKRL
jgi:hypothetical protein